MPSRYLLELAIPGDGYLLEDSTGVLMLEEADDVFIEGLHRIEVGVIAITAAGMGGVLQE